MKTIEQINEEIMELSRNGQSVKKVSDTHHTFDSYIDMRNVYFIALCNDYPELSWKSTKHYDEENDPMFNGDFIAGIYTPKGLVAQHLKLKYWDDLNVKEIERAPQYDGYNDEDIKVRIKSLREKILSIEEKMYNEVKYRCEQPTNTYGIGAWDHHIKIVYELAKKNANEYGANLEIVAIAALLHDIASVTDVRFTEEHHIIGAEIAEQLLLAENYPIEKIYLVKKCILNHRGSRLVDKTTPEEICIADSDAMAHFYSIPSLLSMVYREKGMSIDDGSKFVMDKLDRSYNKMSDKGRELVRGKYKAAKKILTY